MVFYKEGVETTVAVFEMPEDDSINLEPETVSILLTAYKQEHLISYHIHSYFISYTPAKAIPMGHLPRLGYR